MAVLRPYIRHVVKKLDEAADKKIEWLMSKWKREDVVPDMYEGIEIRTNDVTVYDNSPRLYGGVAVDEDEKAALLIPPKFAVFGISVFGISNSS